MSKLGDIKIKIKDTLESLKRQEKIKEIQVDDFKGSVWDRHVEKYPVAILTTPTVENEEFTNSQNRRIYTFPILFILNAQDVHDPEQVEDLIEDIINEFDNDPTLKAGGVTGEADAGVEPASSTPEAVVSRGNSYIAFQVAIRCKAIRDLTFQ